MKWIKRTLSQVLICHDHPKHEAIFSDSCTNNSPLSLQRPRSSQSLLSNHLCSLKPLNRSDRLLSLSDNILVLAPQIFDLVIREIENVFSG